MKRTILIVLVLAFASLACAFPFAQGTPAENTETPVVSQPSSESSESPDSQSPGESGPDSGLLVQTDGYQFIIPDGVASGFQVTTYPEVVGEQDYPYWEIAPEYVEFTLQGYALQDTFHRPRILVYPAARYTELQNGAAESISRIQAILGGGAMTQETLPYVPFFNAGAMINARPEVIPSGNGRGVRVITQYGQALYHINNTALFYLYQGLTEDGQYYIVAILPITHPTLSSSEDPYAPLPPGGFAFPPFEAEVAEFETYFGLVTDLLTNTQPEAFTPSLTSLDALVQSIEVRP